MNKKFVYQVGNNKKVILILYIFEITTLTLITTNSTPFSEHNSALYWLVIKKSFIGICPQYLFFPWQTSLVPIHTNHDCKWCLPFTTLFFKHNHQPWQVWGYIQSNTKRQTNNNTDTQKKVKILHSLQTGLLKSPKKETGLIQSNMRVTQTSPTAPRSSCPVTRMGIKRAESSRHSNLTFPSYRLSSLHSQDHKSLL